MRLKGTLFLLACTAVLAACSGRVVPVSGNATGDTGRYFSLIDSTYSVVSISPFTGDADTLVVEQPFCRIVCMSSSYVAGLEMAGAGESVVGVSGARLIGRDDLPEVGYNGSLEYETILSLKPDVVLAYLSSPAEAQYWKKLEQMGIRVFQVYDFMEEDPLARASYMRLMGRLTGHAEAADSAFAEVSRRYEEIASKVPSSPAVKVLMNVPYGGAWYVPGKENYMSRLFAAAGAEILGAPETAPGTPSGQSGTITMEDAYVLSQEADFWMNPGWCGSKDELRALHQMFGEFPVIGKGVWNNTLKATPSGGNDFWMSGAVRPDLILEDLVRIFHPGTINVDKDYNYYKELI